MYKVNQMALRTWVAVESADSNVDDNIDPKVTTDGDDNAVPVVITTPDPIQLTDTMEQAELNANAVYNEAENLLDQGEDLVSDISDVKKTIDNIEVHDELNSVAAESYTKHVSRICKRWGIAPVKKPAVENYDSRDSRKLAQRVAVEDFKESFKKLSAKFIAWIKGVINNGAKELSAFMDGSKAIITAAKNLDAKVQRLDHDAGGTIDVTSMDGFYINGKYVLNEIIKTGPELWLALAACSEKARIVTQKGTRGLFIDVDAQPLAKMRLLSAIGSSKDIAEVYEHSPDGDYNTSVIMLPGNCAIVQYMSSKGNAELFSLGRITRFVKLTSVKLEEQKIQAPDVDTLKKLCAYMYDTGTMIVRNRNDSDKTKKVVESWEAEIKSLESNRGNIPENDIPRLLREAQLSIRSYKSMNMAYMYSSRRIGTSLNKLISETLKLY